MKKLSVTAASYWACWEQVFTFLNPNGPLLRPRWFLFLPMALILSACASKIFLQWLISASPENRTRQSFWWLTILPVCWLHNIWVSHAMQYNLFLKTSSIQKWNVMSCYMKSNEYLSPTCKISRTCLHVMKKVNKIQYLKCLECLKVTVKIWT